MELCIDYITRLHKCKCVVLVEILGMPCSYGGKRTRVTIELGMGDDKCF